jgi:hypothetical protein
MRPENWKVMEHNGQRPNGNDETPSGNDQIFEENGQTPNDE